MSFVYTLSDPLGGPPVYIGKADDTEVRFRQHIDLRKWDGNFAKRAWIRQLQKEGRNPRIDVVADFTDPSQAFAAEKELIIALRAKGIRLLNIADGGAGASCSKLNWTTPDDWKALSDDITSLRTSVMQLLSALQHKSKGRLGCELEKAEKSLLKAKFATEEYWWGKVPIATQHASHPAEVEESESTVGAD